MPTTERLVSLAGALIGVACCRVETIDISEDFEGWQFRPGKSLVRGIAHASLAIEDVIEYYGVLRDRKCDSNRTRHVGYYALFDWCWGADVQYLAALGEDKALYSHDHGLFLPGGFEWSAALLAQAVDEPRPLSDDDYELDKIEISRIADRLDSLTRQELVLLVSSIPISWPISDEELEHVGAFLERRAPRVAQRLRTR